MSELREWLAEIVEQLRADARAGYPLAVVCRAWAHRRVWRDVYEGDRRILRCGRCGSTVGTPLQSMAREKARAKGEARI